MYKLCKIMIMSFQMGKYFWEVKIWVQNNTLQCCYNQLLQSRGGINFSTFYFFISKINRNFVYNREWWYSLFYKLSVISPIQEFSRGERLHWWKVSLGCLSFLCHLCSGRTLFRRFKVAFFSLLCWLDRLWCPHSAHPPVAPVKLALGSKSLKKSPHPSLKKSFKRSHLR